MLPTDCNEVKSVINALKIDCAVGLDMITADILRTFVDILTPPITYICNLSLSTGVFPKAFKKSRIHPIHKGGARDCVNNYRPISILPTLSKILERIINKRIVKYLEYKKLLSEAQFGFRSGKSSADAAHEVTDFVVQNLDSRKKVLAIFLDLAKAFDTVCVDKLLNKLEKLGVRDLQLKLFQDYLSDRTQCVQIGDHISGELPITFGVPQGSILGPTLFLTYINDLCQLDLPNARIITFADDTVLLFSGNSWDQVFSCAQNGFDQICQWLKTNSLTLNVDKTKFLTFTLRYNNLDLSNYNIVYHTCSNSDSQPCSCPRLQKSTTIKYLGIMIDDRLNFRCHVDMIASRVRKLMSIFKNLRCVADSKLIKTVYYALCQSVLTYCISVWGGTAKSTILKLERAQRGILKVCMSLPYRHPTTELYEKCGVLTVRQLYILQTIIKQHSTLKYEPNIINSKRRKDIVCTQKKFNCTFSHRFFCYQGCNLYNKINRILTYYSLPKQKLKIIVKEWLQKLSYTDTEKLV